MRPLAADPDSAQFAGHREGVLLAIFTKRCVLATGTRHAAGFGERGAAVAHEN